MEKEKIKKTIKIIFKIFVVYIIVILAVNISGWFLLEYPLNKLNNRGLIIKIKPLSYAVVLAHGHYNCMFDNSSQIEGCTHMTTYKDSTIRTKILLDDLKKDGYNKVWGSWCNTNSDLMEYKLNNNTSYDDIIWYDWVTRNQNGYHKTYPFFTGFNFIYLPRVIAEKLS